MKKEDNRPQPSDPENQEEIGYSPRVVVKFRDHVELPYEDGVEKYFEELHLGPHAQLMEKFPNITFKRLYTALDPEKINQVVDQATELDDAFEPPNLLTYFVVTCPPGVDPDLLAKELSSWETVQTAYFDPPGEEPQVIPDDDPHFDNQGYLDPAPNGIDAEFAWTIVGGDGVGLKVIDLERGWTLNHEDLNAHGATLLHGSIRDESRAHGTAVLGEICAVDNTIGCIGITPEVASVHAVSYWGSTRPNAILAAIANLAFGDVLLLEAQVSIQNWPMMPIEVLDAEFDTIRLATALGIVVVEAAGNGGHDLDTYTDVSGNAIFNRGAPGFRDSGAIIVGAASSTAPHTRLNFSNYGSRIDCYAWGENVDTCYSDNAGSTTLYTGGFNGTSSASPIITGAVLAVQAIAEPSLGYRFSPGQIRYILSNSGTPSNNPAVDRIGVMPNLQAILQDVLNLVPDIYIRDNVGDTGDPHTGSISASPDIILRPTAVATPQASFGEGSGTENSYTLGYEAEAGQDNYLYVRVRNRGGSPANNVKATVYWAPVATLITPDLWTLVGDVTIQNVSEGNVLTVSDAIIWDKSEIPATGHYCFVGLVGNDQDPAPDLADLLDWNNFNRFIRENNNVTWRNFNVVDNEPDPEEDPNYVLLPFLAPGAPDKSRRMQLEVVANLPRGARLRLEVRPNLIDGWRFRELGVDRKRDMARLRINPHGSTKISAQFPCKSKGRARLLVYIPKEKRDNEYEVFVRQLYRKKEVGRVTWRLMPRKRINEL